MSRAPASIHCGTRWAKAGSEPVGLGDQVRGCNVYKADAADERKGGERGGRRKRKKKKRRGKKRRRSRMYCLKRSVRQLKVLMRKNHKTAYAYAMPVRAIPV